MKIYNRKEFLKLPKGIFFAKGVEFSMDGFCIKDETIHDDNGHGIDFFYHNLVQIDSHDSCQDADRKYDMLYNNSSYPMNKSLNRDGMFDDDDIFLVFENDDLLDICRLICKTLDLSFS